MTLAPARRVCDRWDSVQAGTRTKSRTPPRIITPLSWGLCQLGLRRRAEQGQAVTRPHPEVVTRPPHVTAPAAGTGSRPRGAAGSSNRSELPLGGCRGTGQTGARFLPGSRCDACPRGRGRGWLLVLTGLSPVRREFPLAASTAPERAGHGWTRLCGSAGAWGVGT